jgi:hypothetical protein
MSDKERSPSPEFSPLEFGEDLAPLPEYKAAGTTAVDFSGLLGEPLKLHEDLTSGCGGQLWPAGLVLAKHMLRYHQDRMQHARMSVMFPMCFRDFHDSQRLFSLGLLRGAGLPLTTLPARQT